MGLVMGVVRKIARRLPPCVEVDDLKSAGYLGLIEAVDTFDSARGVPFEAHVRYRIWGRVMDHLRGLDAVTRSQRQAMKVSGQQTIGEFLQPPEFWEWAEQRVPDPGPATDVTTITRAEAERLLHLLNDREREVVERCVIRGEAMWRVGESLGVCESRISQIKSTALKRMNEAL